LNLMASDIELYETCKRNCLNSIEHLSYDVIKKKWGNLLREIL